jgi:hypothetical protein
MRLCRYRCADVVITRIWQSLNRPVSGPHASGV